MHRVLGLLLLILAAPAPAQHNLASALQPFVDQHTLAGAVVLVATPDRILSLEAVGYSDLAARKPMTTDDLFWIASMNKPITATAFMMLVDEGKVRVDDPVEKYLPEFKGQMYIAEKDETHTLLKKPAHPILVRDILSHTAGLTPISPIERPTFDLLPLETAVRSHAMSALKFEPGTKYEYSNAGINTAGRIIEVVSRMPYEKFLEERLFRPLGMKDTTFRPTAEQVRRLAKSYKASADRTGLEETPVNQVFYPLDDPRRQPFPAGGLFSTASDMAKFCQMILNGGISNGRTYLSAASLEQMTSRQTPPAVEQSYGFGWTVGVGSFGHGGAYKTDMTIRPKQGIIEIFLVQQAGPWPNGGDKTIVPAFRAAATKLSR